MNPTASQYQHHFTAYLSPDVSTSHSCNEECRIQREAPAMYELVERMATWKEREDGLVYGDEEPLTEYLLEARAILARIDRER